MNIAVEISYYPLMESFDTPIHEFISLLKENKAITLEVGKMSSVISGEYEEVMRELQKHMETVMEKFPSIFNLKIANIYPV